MELVTSKIIYLFRLPKISVAYSVTAVKTIFAYFQKNCKTKKNVQISILSFVRTLIFNFLRSSATKPKPCCDQIIYIYIYIYIYIQISATITKGLLPNPQ